MFIIYTRFNSVHGIDIIFLFRHQCRCCCWGNVYLFTPWYAFLFMECFEIEPTCCLFFFFMKISFCCQMISIYALSEWNFLYVTQNSVQALIASIHIMYKNGENSKMRLKWKQTNDDDDDGVFVISNQRQLIKNHVRLICILYWKWLPFVMCVCVCVSLNIVNISR